MGVFAFVPAKRRRPLRHGLETPRMAPPRQERSAAIRVDLRLVRSTLAALSLMRGENAASLSREVEGQRTRFESELRYWE